MRDLHLPARPLPPILLKRYRRNAVVALEPGQGRKTAALRDAHQVPLLTGGALFVSSIHARVAGPEQIWLEGSWIQNRSGRCEQLEPRVPHTVSCLKAGLRQMVGSGRERRNLPEGQTDPLGRGCRPRTR